MNASTLKLKPGQSLFARSCQADESVSDNMMRSKTKQYSGLAALNPEGLFPVARQTEKTSEEESYMLMRKSSILSYQNLSIGDCTSVNDSQYSLYNPSINEPFVSDDADPEEKAMHSFLDCCGVFQVNVKMQLEEEKKSVCSASPSLKQRLSLVRSKNSPSFIERRRRLLSNKDSTAGSSSGAKSTGLRIALNSTGPTFSTDMFTAGAGSKASSIPGQVAEEPNSDNSIKEKKSALNRNKIEISCASEEMTSSPPCTQTKIPIGLAKLCSDDNSSDQGVQLQ